MNVTLVYWSKVQVYDTMADAAADVDQSELEVEYDEPTDTSRLVLRGKLRYSVSKQEEEPVAAGTIGGNSPFTRSQDAAKVTEWGSCGAAVRVAEVAGKADGLYDFCAKLGEQQNLMSCDIDGRTLYPLPQNRG